MKKVLIEHDIMKIIIFASVIFFVMASVWTVNNKKTQIDSQASQGIPQNLPTTALERFEKKLTPNFPDVPIYPGAEIEHSYHKSEGNLVGFEAVWHTSDDPKETMDWYIEQLPGKGWQIISTSDPDNHIEPMTVFQKGNMKGILLTEREDGPDTEIILEFTLSPKQ